MIDSLFVAKKPREQLQQVPEVQVVAGAGITGDRHFNKKKHPGQNITFIECEAIEQYNRDYHQAIAISATRRNVLTRGVDLNALVGKEFTIGNALFKGIELCTPCSVMGKLLANNSITSAEVIRAFRDSGGLRADIIRGGVIAVGMAFEIPPIEIQTTDNHT